MNSRYFFIAHKKVRPLHFLKNDFSCIEERQKQEEEQKKIEKEKKIKEEMAKSGIWAVWSDLNPDPTDNSRYFPPEREVCSTRRQFSKRAF